MKTLVEKSVLFNTERNIPIENANFKFLKGKNISFKYKYVENGSENEEVIYLILPNEEDSLIKDFIISQINIKLSGFVEEKNDIFVANSELEQENKNFQEIDARQFFTKL